MPLPLSLSLLPRLATGFLLFIHGVKYRKITSRLSFLSSACDNTGASEFFVHRRMVNDRWEIMNSSSELEDGQRHKNQVRARSPAPPRGARPVYPESRSAGEASLREGEVRGAISFALHTVR